jgi:glycosyltransferase involved in cell wall biosynthesis
MSKSGLRLALLADAAHVNIQRWCEGLSRAGADLHVLSFRAPLSTTGQTHQLPVSQMLGKFHYITSVPYVRQLIREIEPEVVVAYYVTGYGTLGALAGHHPLVQVTSGSDVLLAPRNPVMRRLLRYNLGRADLVTAWAPHMASAAKALGVPEDRILVMPRGIPVDHFASARSSTPASGDSINLISTRSLKAEYNLPVLIDALRLLRDEGVNFRLTLAGDGPQRGELMEMAERLDLKEQIRFAGFVSNDELPKLLSEHNMYISMVDSDGVSASLLEAMAVGLMPMVPDNPANRFWIKQNENGTLMNSLAPQSVAQAIRDAFFNVGLRRKAWELNSDRVRRDADLFENSKRFLARFQQLARRQN